MSGRARSAPQPRGQRRTPPRVTKREATGGHLDVDALIADRSVQIIVCCGSGGVGKTTTSAAIAMRAADAGRRVCVLTIDPARRLAQSMGLTELDNTPRNVPGAGANGGSLDAMMLDMKRTFDEVVQAHASPEKAEQIFANPFYQALSSSFAGTQEYMAMEKLGQLHAQTVADGDDKAWDLIVVDTPPSRSALDFLDAPERLSSLLDGRFIKLILMPAKGPARLLTAGFSVVTGAISKVLGAQMLADVQTFIAAFDTLFGGFRQRAEATYSLLQNPGTAFLVVAAPEPAAMREASYFVERLAGDEMPLAGLVVNRVHDDVRTDVGLDDTRATAARLRKTRGVSAQVAELLDVHAERLASAAREQRERDAFARLHPGVPQVPVTALSSDVHDLDGLRRIGDLLARSSQS